jgi:hypothetical protein
MNPKALNNILFKVARSHKHLIDLEEAWKKFMMDIPLRITKTVDIERKIVIVYVEEFKEIPLEIRILAGEVVTHLRSALDQMIWQLSLLFTATPPKATQFPIYESSKEFEKRGLDQVAALNDELKKIILEMQPYNSTEPKSHWLWVLHRLANDDKHRFITIVATSTTGLGADFLLDGMAMEARVGPVSKGSELFRLDYSGCTGEFQENIKVDVKPKISLNMCLELENDNTLRPLSRTIRYLGEMVENAARQFEPFFLGR